MRFTKEMYDALGGEEGRDPGVASNVALHCTCRLPVYSLVPVAIAV
jgi:hypothetical protein